MSTRKIVLIFAGCVIALLVLGIFSITNRFNTGLEAEIASIKARGEPTTPAELDGPKVPNSENAAIVLQQAVIAVSSPSYKPDSDLLNKDSKNIMTMSPKELATYKAAIMRHQDVMNLLEEAISKPKCHISRDWSQGFALICQDLAKCRDLVKFCNVNALVYAKCGNMDEAVRSLRVGYRTAELLRDDPTITSQLARIACLAIMSKSMHTCLYHGGMNERQAKILFDDLGAIDIMRGYPRAIEGERIIFLIGMKTIRGSDLSSGIEINTPNSSMTDAGQKILGTVYGKVAMKGDMTLYLRFLDTQHQAGKLNYAQSKAKGLLDQDVPAPFYAVITKNRGSSDGELMKHHVSHCRLSGDRVLLALTAYKARYGSYPATYEELKNKLGWRLPSDPFSDKDFIYRPQGKGFILYSVGPNMKDDGGIQNEKRFFVGTETEDFVWKMNK